MHEAVEEARVKAIHEVIQEIQECVKNFESETSANMRVFYLVDLEHDAKRLADLVRSMRMSIQVPVESDAQPRGKQRGNHS